jgi:hypothetical protein
MLSAMLEAGPELQPAVDAMHAVVPQSDLFKTQVRAAYLLSNESIV